MMMFTICSIFLIYYIYEFKFITTVKASVLDLQIYYPEYNINKTVLVKDQAQSLFWLWIYSCEENHINSNGYYTFGTNVCPGGEVNRNVPQSLSDPLYFPNYTVSNLYDRVGPNHWNKKFNLENTFTGRVYIAITSVQSPYGNILYPPCLEAICSQIGMPWTTVIDSVSQTAEIFMFPAFGTQETGVVKILLPDFPSNILYPMTRDIPVYIPPTLIQNNITREINIMILNDGDMNNVVSYSLLYGFQQSVLTGQIPESIMIGIPQTNTSANRQYELTYSVCNSSFWGKFGNENVQTGTKPTATAYYGCPNSLMEEPSGGNDKFLQWVNQSVIPAVLKKLKMIRGEVSIMGGSYGGLTSCYAPSKYPEVFARGYCFAAAVQWNFAELADVIINNYKVTKKRPKSIVMELGHEAYDVFQNYNSKEILNLMQLTNKVYNAWLSIGMNPLSWGLTDFPPNSQDSYLTAIPSDSINNNNTITWYYQRAAIHLVSTWEMGLSEGLPLLYRADFPAVNKSRIQRSNNLQFVSLPPTTTTSNSAANSNNNIIIGLSVALAITGLTSIVFAVLYFLSLKNNNNNNNNKSSSSQMFDVTTKQDNPMTANVI